jgi:nucleoside-diphosphate-sugar epimerase
MVQFAELAASLMNKLIRIGITSIGSGVGQSVVQSCRLSHLPLRIVGLGANPFAFGAFDCHVRAELPTIYAAGYIQALLDCCKKHEIQILIPGLDDELLPLARSRDEFSAIGTDVIVSAVALLELCRDKLSMSRELSKVCPTFVEGYDRETLLCAAATGTLSYPMIAKPKSGFASRGVLIINGPADLEKVTSAHVVQTIAVPRHGDSNRDPFLAALQEGQLTQVGELSAQILIGKRGEELGRMLSCHRLNSGIPVEIVPAEADLVWAQVARLLPALRDAGLRGPLNIQGRLTDAGPRFFEMNARFTGITGIRALMGFNEVEAIIADALEIPPQPRRLIANPRRIGIRQVADRVVDSGLDSALASALTRHNEYSPGRNGRRVLVTGANSYLGLAVLNGLARTTGVDSVVALVRQPERFRFVVPAAVQVRSLTELYDGAFSLGEFEVVCHLASARPVHSTEAIAASLQFTRDLMCMIAKYQVPGVINVSSQSVYGQSRPPLWTEDMPPRPETPYAQAKWACELMTAMTRSMNNTTATTSVRLAQLIGHSPGMRWTEVPHLFSKLAYGGEQISLRGGQQELDYINVRDAADLICRLAVHPFDSWPPLLNAGSGAPVTLLALAELIARTSVKVCGRQPVISLDPTPVELRLGMSIALSSETLGWQPRLGLGETIEELLLILPDQRG